MIKNYKCIFITGASSGIGAELAKLYSRDGVILGLLGRDFDKLNRIASLCKQKGAKVFMYSCDIQNTKDLICAINDFQSNVTQVDLIIANAGIRKEEDENYENPEIYKEIFDTNVLGLINSIIPFISGMKKNKSGHIVAISSIASLRSTPNSGIYSASKAAVNLWTESLRQRLDLFNIKVTTVCLGFVKTEMTADLKFWMPGIIEPQEAAVKISRAIISNKRLVTLPWKSGYLWRLFALMPGKFYDFLILWTKKNIYNN